MHATFKFHWGPPDPPGILAASLLASAAEQLVDHVLIKQNTMG